MLNTIDLEIYLPEVILLWSSFLLPLLFGHFLHHVYHCRLRFLDSINCVLMRDDDGPFLLELVQAHTSGQVHSHSNLVPIHIGIALRVVRFELLDVLYQFLEGLFGIVASGAESGEEGGDSAEELSVHAIECL